MVNRVLLSIPGLELKNKRGTGFYAKSVLYALQGLPVDVDLLVTATNSTAEKINDKLANGEKEDFLFKSRLKQLFFCLYSQIFPSLYRDRIKVVFDASLYSSINLCYNFPLLHNISYLWLKFTNRTISINTNEYDLFFSTEPCSVNVSSNTKVVQTLHDVIPLEECEKTPYGVVFKKTLKKMLDNSDLILSVSEYSKQKLNDYYPNHGVKIIVTHQPVPFLDKDLNFLTNDVVNKVLNRFDVKSKQFFFYVGAIEDRKNIMTLIEIFRDLKNNIGIPLILAGSINNQCLELAEEMELIKEGKYSNIKYLGYLSDDEKIILLKEALIFLFLSESEGFGIPPLEAMKMNTPVICSNKTSLPEVCGDAALYVDPSNKEDVINSIISLFNDSKLRNKLVTSGKGNVLRFTFDNFQLNLKAALEEV